MNLQTIFGLWAWLCTFLAGCRAGYEIGLLADFPNHYSAFQLVIIGTALLLSVWFPASQTLCDSKWKHYLSGFGMFFCLGLHVGVVGHYEGLATLAARILLLFNK